MFVSFRYLLRIIFFYLTIDINRCQLFFTVLDPDEINFLQPVETVATICHYSNILLLQYYKKLARTWNLHS